jgi:hypothetical protein
LGEHTGGKVTNRENQPRKKTKDGSAGGREIERTATTPLLSGGGFACAGETPQQPQGGRCGNRVRATGRKEGFSGEEALLGSGLTKGRP